MDLDWLICCLCGEVIEDYMLALTIYRLRDSPVKKIDVATCNVEKVIPSNNGYAKWVNVF